MDNNNKIEKPVKMADPNPNLRNIIIMSMGYSLLVAAFLTMGAIEQIVLESASKDDPTFHGDGYISLALIYGVYSMSNFLAPSIIATIGVRTAMVMGSLVYAAFIASFMHPTTWLLYALSGLLGFVASMVWVSNGIYFTRCCNKGNIDKNMGIYWTILSTGPLLGNAFVYWRFQGRSHIDAETRTVVSLALTCISGLATVTFLFLRIPVMDTKEGETKRKDKKSVCSALTSPFRLLGNKHMLLLIPASIYNGFETAIFSGILPTAVGFTEGFGSDARKLVGIVGIVFFVGTIFGGLVFGIFGKYTLNSNRSLALSIACATHVISAALIYLNLPDESSLGPTSNVSWFNPPSVWIVVIGSFIMGIGDGCLLPQVCASIGVIWPEDPSGALALFRFFQCGSCALGFFCGTMTGLYNQMAGFIAITLIGTAAFCVNEMLIARKDKVAPVTTVGIAKKFSVDASA